MPHSQSYQAWVQSWKPNGPETTAIFKPVICDQMHMESFWRQFCEDVESTTERYYLPDPRKELDFRVSASFRDLWECLRGYMLLDVHDKPAPNSIAAIPVWLSRLEDISASNDRMKLVIASFCYYFADLWSEPSTQESQAIAEQYARELSRCRYLEQEDIKPFLAKLRVVAERFNIDHKLFSPVHWAVGCTSYFIEELRPTIVRSPRVRSYTIPASIVSALQQGEVPPLRLW